MGSSYGESEVLLKEILSVIKPFDEDVRIRHHVINEFKSVVACVESLRGATVEPFGSFVSNLYTRWGDLDISIEIPNGSLVSSVGKNRKQRLLRDLRRALQKRGVARNIQFIPKARVPLLIFESNYQSISCDISVSNLLGQLKSKLFFWITEMDERFRDMVLLVKEWAKTQKINNSKIGTLNSYSLSLLVIFHFQTCEPPILPPLQEIYAGNIAHDLKGERVSAEREILDICAKNIASFKTNKMGYTNRSPLAELFISFFKKFSRIHTEALDHAICTYTGKWEHTMSTDKWMGKDYSLIIEDPFDQSDNCARAVGKNQLIRISEAFEETSHKLSSNQERGSLIISLVRSQIRSHFTASSQGNPNVHGGGFGHRSDLPSTSRPIHGQSQSLLLDTYSSPNNFPQRQQLSNSVHTTSNGLQNMRLDIHPSPSAVFSQRDPFNNTVSPIQNQYENRRTETTPSPSPLPQRSGQAVRGQGQQMWRARNSYERR